MSKIMKSISLVLLLVDDFTNRIITDSSVCVYTEEGRQASIRKSEGYHIFCDLQQDPVRICVESPIYQKMVVELPLSYGEEVNRIRMIPAAGYPITAGATCIRGKLRQGSRLLIFFPEQKKNYKLLYDYNPKKQGKEISLFQQDGICLEGKTLCIKNKEYQEFFKILRQQDEICRMEQPLKKEYKKIGTLVYSVHEAYANQDGSIYLPVRMHSEELKKCFWTISSNGEETSGSWELMPGKENWITEDFQIKKEEA